MSEKEDQSVEQETEDDAVVEETPKVNHKKRSSRFRRKGKGGTPQAATPTFKGEITSLKDEVFIHSQIHTKKWITARQKFINYASKTYGGNEETSLELKKDRVPKCTETLRGFPALCPNQIEQSLHASINHNLIYDL